MSFRIRFELMLGLVVCRPSHAEYLGAAKLRFNCYRDRNLSY